LGSVFSLLYAAEAAFVSWTTRVFGSYPGIETDARSAPVAGSSATTAPFGTPFWLWMSCWYAVS
jgi:hypothetical protein